MTPENGPLTDTEQNNAPSDQANASQVAGELHWLERLNIFGQMGLVIVGVIAASIYGCQLHEMKRTNDLTQAALNGSDHTLTETLGRMDKQIIESKRLATNAEQSRVDTEKFFRIDERAWVEIYEGDKIDTYPPEGSFQTIFKYSFYLKNIGKTVARDVRVHIDNINGGAAVGSDKKSIRLFQDSKWKDSKSGKLIPPSINPGPETLAPGGISTAPIYSGDQEPRRLSNGDFRYGYMLGRIDYIDAFDTPHWVHFCFTIMNSKGELGHCQFGNDEDNNGEKTPLRR